MKIGGQEKKSSTPTKINTNPVTSVEAVNVTTNSAISDTAYGKINKSSFITSFTIGLNEILGQPGVIEFGKLDAEKILGLAKTVDNEAIKTAHVALQDGELSSISVWNPLTNLRVTKKGDRKSQNPALLKVASDYKAELIAAGHTEEQAEENADYARLKQEWMDSATVSDNAGKSVVKIKEITIEKDGSTPIDAAKLRAPVKAKK